MKKPWIVFVILLAGGLAWWLASGPGGEAPDPSEAATPEPTPAAENPMLAGRDTREVGEAHVPEPDDTREPSEAGPAAVRDDRPRHVTGWVFHADGSPAVGIGLQAMPAPPTSGTWGRGLTQADGSFRIEKLDPGQAYRVRTNFDMKTPGSDRIRCYSEIVKPGAEDVRIVLTRGVFLEGRVTREDGGEPVLAIVHARPLDEREDLEGNGFAKVEADGRYRLGPLPAGRYTVEASPRKLPRFGPSAKREVTAPDTRVDFVLPARGVIRGRLLGAKQVRFRFDWRGAGGQHDHEGIQRGGTQKDGSFVVPSIPDRPGVVYFWVQNEDRFALLTGVRPGEEPIDARLKQGARIQGRLDLPAWAKVRGKPYDLGRVYVRSLTHGFGRWDTVDSTGAFTVRGLPEGRYALWFIALAWTQLSIGEEVEARAGDTGVVVPFGEVKSK